MGSNSSRIPSSSSRMRRKNHLIFLFACRSAEASFKVYFSYLPHEDMIYDAYMQKVDAIMLCLVNFVSSQFLLEVSPYYCIPQCLSGILPETNL